jgi:hypothetical protein
MKILCLVSTAALFSCATNPPTQSDQSSSAPQKADEITNNALAFEDAYMQCFDGNVEIGIYADGDFVEESLYGMGDLQFSPLNRIKIRNGEEIVELAQNTLFTTDGAGNDTFQVLYLDGNEIVPVVHMYYDHEQGWLDGYYALPEIKTGTRNDGSIWANVVGFGENIAFEGESMNCYDYTFGDL